MALVKIQSWFITSCLGHVLSIHKVVLNRGAKVLSCTQCGYVTSQALRLSEHMNAHSQTRTFHCHICSKAFVLKSTLDQHLSFVHRQGAELTCAYCEYVTHAQKQLVYHLKVKHTHKDAKPYACPYCTYTCKASNNAVKHVRQKHPGQEVRCVKLFDITAKDVYDVMHRDTAVVMQDAQDVPMGGLN